MESLMHNLFSETCGRPRHLRTDQWRVHDSPIYRPSIHDREGLIRKKAIRRLEQWWRIPPDTAEPVSAPNAKLLEAKRRHFTSEGKSERVARSLAALSQPPHSQLSGAEWRKIMEDQDLEDQFF